MNSSHLSGKTRCGTFLKLKASKWDYPPDTAGVSGGVFLFGGVVLAGQMNPRLTSFIAVSVGDHRHGHFCHGI